MGHRLPTGILALFAFLALIAGPVVVVYLAITSEPQDIAALEHSEGVSTVHPEERVFDFAEPAEIEVIFADPPILTAPLWSGVVTGVSTERRTLRTGDTPISIDNVDRIVAAIDTPFYRTLRRGDSGPDVRELSSLLATLGWYDGEPSLTYTRSLQSAVESWAESLGVDQSRGVFDPGWVIRLPHDGFALAEVDALVGGAAPTPLAPFAVGERGSVGIIARSAAGISLDLTGQWIAESDSGLFVIRDGVVDQDALAELIRESVDGIVQVTLRRDPPEVLTLVPPSAVVLDSAGRTCVVVVVDGLLSPQIVDVAPAFGGSVAVTAGLQPGVEVVVDPSSVTDTDLCSSA